MLQDREEEAEDKDAIEHEEHGRDEHDKVEGKVREDGRVPHQIAQQAHEHHEEANDTAPPGRMHVPRNVFPLQFQQHATKGKERHHAQKRKREHPRKNRSVSM
ncbi:hypothetical protein PsorP6_006745 [Peronosclerospora sorghi]|uniref:Uncharacterized protein n=1 Tax=Peronosclerospora sorghi TaxID=230839 RepID=A0ACC0W278_9STRA|nr:hypothetical protein PsorP6_006745 [Peronosclerospora sorghi]